MANYDDDVDAEQEQIFDRPDAEYRIYVNCLPPELDEVAIKEVFNQYGRITGIFYPPKASWAYITYNSYREAERAIRELNDRRPLYLKVTLAKRKSVIKEEELQRSPVSETSGGTTKDVTAEPSMSTYNDTKYQQSMGRGRTMNMNALCKHLGSQMTMSDRSTENESLPSSSQASNPYEIEESTLNTDNLWTRGMLTVTEDGRRFVTLGRGFTRYEIPKPHPKTEEYILKVIEKREKGLYEYGDDKLKNEVQKCYVCPNKTNKHCEQCNTYYCSKSCQTNDWPRHELKCQRIPKLVEDSVKDISLQINKDENQTSIPLTLNKTITSKTIASNEVKLRRPNVSNVMQAESSNNTDANTNMHKNNVDITNYSTNNGINDREHLSSIHDNDTNVCTTKTADQPASTMNTKDFSRQNQLQRCNNTKEDIEMSKRNDRYSTSNQNHYSRNHNGAIRKTIPDKGKSDNSNLRNKNYNSDRSYQKNELQINKKPTIYNDRENGPGSNFLSSSIMVDEDLNFCKDTYLSKTEFTEVQILVSLDNDEYWIATLKDSDTRMNLMTKLQDIAEKTRNVQPIIDGVYAVRWEDLWHRAVIMSLNPVKVRYLDYGKDEILEKDAEIRGIPRDMVKIPPLARKIRLTPAASKRCKNFRYDDIIFVKMLSIDAHKTIIVDVREQSEHLFSPVKNASNNTNTTEKFVRQENASNENLKTSKVQIPSILNAFADLFTRQAVSELEFTGLIQIHESTQENIYSASLVIQNFNIEVMTLLDNLQEDCANAQESAHYKPQVEDLLCGEGKDNWYRGYILSSSTSSDLRIIAIDEARIVEVNKIIPCPEKYLNIYAIGVICEISHPNKLELGVYPFTGIMNEQNRKQENLKIKIIKDSKLVCEAIIKSWKSMINNSDKSLVVFSEIKNGSQICLTSYRNHYHMFARSLDEEAVEYYNDIMQRVAQCARTAPYQSDPPKNKQVIAPFSDGNRYRALVIKIQNDKAQIVYTDFGNVDEVNVKELQILPENLALQRSCSAKISLKDVPSGVSMNANVDLFLRELVGNETPLKCVYEGDSFENGVYLTMPTKESVNDKIKQLLIPNWKQKDQEDNTCYMLRDMEVADLGREGDIVNAVVLHVTSQETGIYMMASFDIELYTHITQVMPKLLREYCEKAEYYIPRKEELCLALYENEWYRATCLEPKQSYTTANILYIDYGNMAEVEHKNIRLMPKDFITPAAVANLCTVVNLAPVDDSGNYSPAIRQKLAELVQPESTVKIKIVKFSESGDYEIELVDVKKTLIEEGLVSS